MNCRSLITSSSIMTLRPALPSIFVMVSMAMFLRGMIDYTEQFQVLVQRLQKGRYLHRAPTHHVVDLYHFAQALDLFGVIEVTQIPLDSLVYLLTGKLVPARRGLSRTGARAYSHHVLRVLTDRLASSSCDSEEIAPSMNATSSPAREFFVLSAFMCLNSTTFFHSSR